PGQAVQAVLSCLAERGVRRTYTKLARIAPDVRDRRKIVVFDRRANDARHTRRVIYLVTRLASGEHQRLDAATDCAERRTSAEYDLTAQNQRLCERTSRRHAWPSEVVHKIPFAPCPSQCNPPIPRNRCSSVSLVPGLLRAARKAKGADARRVA